MTDTVLESSQFLRKYLDLSVYTSWSQAILTAPDPGSYLCESVPSKRTWGTASSPTICPVLEYFLICQVKMGSRNEKMWHKEQKEQIDIETFNGCAKLP